MIRARLSWAALPYMAVAAGMIFLRSAWAALIGFHLAMLPLLLPGRQTPPLPLASVSLRRLLPVALTGLVAGLLAWLLWPWLRLPPDLSVRLALGGSSGWLIVAYFSLANPVLEEFYWRGRLGSASSILQPVDFLYAGYHLLVVGLFLSPAWNLAIFVILVAVSWAWRQLTRRFQSLLPAVLCHMLADFSLILVVAQKAIHL